MRTDALFELLGKVDDDLISAVHEPILLRKDKKTMKTKKDIVNYVNYFFTFDIPLSSAPIIIAQGRL